MLSGPVSLLALASQLLNSPATLTAAGAAPWNVKGVPQARCGMTPPSPVVTMPASPPPSSPPEPPTPARSPMPPSGPT